MNDKRALVALLLSQIEAEVETAKQRARTAADAATHEENRPENSKDMRSTEASYVARGQAAHAAEAESALSELMVLTVRDFDEGDTIALSALIDVETSGVSTRYFLLPSAGGRKLSAAGQSVTTLTPKSPIGRALIGCIAGEVIEVATPQGKRSIEIVGVS